MVMIYQDVLEMMPDYWSPMDTNVRYTTIPLLDKYTDEYLLIKSHLGKKYLKFCSAIYRVQNPLLWAKFCMKRDEYQRRGSVEIKTLFHDTSSDNIDSICEVNFDWRMGERRMFGPGVYFSVRPDIAFKHSSKKNDTSRAMFVVDVLVQNIQKVNEEIFLPDPGYDTVLAHKDQTYVKYFDCEYYPRYFIVYEMDNHFVNHYV